MGIRLALAIGLGLLATNPALAQPTPPKRPPALTKPEAKTPATPKSEAAKSEPGTQPAAAPKTDPSPKNQAPAPEPQGPPIAAAPAKPGCFEALAARHGDGVRREEPKEGKGDTTCRVVDPVRVSHFSIKAGEGTRKIDLEPPVLLGCEMATAAGLWLETSVQPLTRGYFGKDLATLRVGGGHECRNRNRATSGKLSEHATGRALDIFALVPEGGEAVIVEKPADPFASRFLDAIRQSACGAFMTALGPGSDAAHANHIHVDIQQRRSGASRFCQ